MSFTVLALLLFSSTIVALSHINGLSVENGTVFIQSCTFDNESNTICLVQYTGTGGRIVSSEASTPYLLPSTNGSIPNWLVAKFSAQRQLLWPKLITGNLTSSQFRSVGTDRFNNIYVYAFFDSNFPMYLHSLNGTDAVENVVDINSSPVTLLLKLSGNGNTIWTLQLSGAYGSLSHYAMVVDKQRDFIYVAAATSLSSLTLGSVNPQGPTRQLLNPGGWIHFVCQYTLEGTLMWAARSTGHIDSGLSILSIDKQRGHLLLADAFQSSSAIYESRSDISNAPFKQVKYNWANPNTRSAALVKYDINGTVVWRVAIIQGKFTWARLEVKAIGVDSKGDIVITGLLVGDAYLYNPLNQLAVRTSVTGYYGSYLFKYSANGNIVWTNIIDDPSYYENGFGLAIDKDDAIWFTGTYATPNMNFRSVGSSQVLSLVGTGDGNYGFVAQYSSNGVILSASRIYSLDNSSSFTPNVNVDDNNNGNVLIFGFYRSRNTRFQEKATEQPFFISQNGSRASFMWYLDINMQILPLQAYKVCTVNGGRLNLLPHQIGRSMPLVSVTTNSTTKVVCDTKICFISQNNFPVPSANFTLTLSTDNTMFYVPSNFSLAQIACSDYISTLGYITDSGKVQDGTFQVYMGPLYGYRNYLDFDGISNSSRVLFVFTIQQLNSELVIGLTTLSGISEIILMPNRIQMRSESFPTIVQTVSVLNGSVNAQWKLLFNHSKISLVRNSVTELSMNFNGPIQSIYISTWEGPISLRDMRLITPPADNEFLNLDPIPPSDRASTSITFSVSVTQNKLEYKTSNAQTTTVISVPSLDPTKEPLIYIGSPIFYMIIGGSGFLLLLLTIAGVFLIRRRRQNDGKDNRDFVVTQQNTTMFENSNINGSIAARRFAEQTLINNYSVMESTCHASTMGFPMQQVSIPQMAAQRRFSAN